MTRFEQEIPLSRPASEPRADDTRDPIDRESSHRRLILGLLVLGMGVIVLTIGLVVYAPLYQERTARELLWLRGAEFNTARIVPEWIERQIGRGVAPGLPHVIWADLSTVELSQDELATLLAFPHLTHLEIKATQLGDESVEVFRRLPKLSWLVLIDSRGISARAEAELLAANPRLRITRRGAAFLGIVSLHGRSECLVRLVQPGSAAEAAGLRINDRIVSLNNKPVASFEDLIKRLDAHEPADEVTLGIQRGPQLLKLAATLTPWPTVARRR